MDEARVFTVDDLRIGLEAEFEREIAEGDVASFADLSHDWNPLHINQTYAEQTNYGGRIVHGAFQVALASAMAGMYLPGRQVVVGSFLCRFAAPLRYPSRVRVRGEITAWIPQSASGTLRVRVVELSSLTLTSEIHVGFALHESRAGHLQEREEPEIATTPQDRPIVLVTGASGGLGHSLASTLSEAYRVIGMARSVPEPSKQIGLEWVAADLSSADWEQAVERQLRGRPLYGVVHAAWPTGPQGSLLDLEADAIGAQVQFGSVATVRIARLLRSRAVGSARLVILGTTAATLKPVLNMSAYSLGKATLEHTVRLLAPELARSAITINLVVPSFVPVGMNSSKTNRVILSETAKVPLGKLCAPEDVSRAVEFFLSGSASFITGQMLPLTGGQL
jgi:NAD(P)-dependent dehydrogenase (short-subunit alcohol dehydrogenase family)/acyl dehydratase